MFGRKPSTDDQNTQASSVKDQAIRKSAARAKPARDVAGSVRVSSASSKAPVMMSKEEKKAARREASEASDRRMAIVNLLLKQDKTYARYNKIWWTGIIAGLISTAVSWFTMNKNSFTLDYLSIATLVLAYVFIIGAFIFDFVKRRPLRNKMDAKVAAMTPKRQMEILDKERQASLEADLKKAKTKADKKK